MNLQKKKEEKDQPEANTGGVNAKLSLSDYFTFSSMQRPLQTNPYLRVGLGPLVEIYRVENIYYLRKENPVSKCIHIKFSFLYRRGNARSDHSSLTIWIIMSIPLTRIISFLASHKQCVTLYRTFRRNMYHHEHFISLGHFTRSSIFSQSRSSTRLCIT